MLRCMARVKIELLIDEYAAEFRKVLAQAVTESIPGIEFDEQELYRAFRRQIVSKLGTWVRVRNDDVEV